MDLPGTDVEVDADQRRHPAKTLGHAAK